MPIEPMLTEETPASALVARVLEEAGIEMVFGISGGHTGRIVSGLSKYQNSVRTVLVREESLAGVMAEVYGRLTRRPGILLGQGPWVLGNGMIGIIEAHLSSSPMLLLTDFSDAPHFALHAPYQQGTGDWGSWDARRAFGGVTKHVMQAHDPVAAVQATQLGIKHALSGQPGPVAILYSHDSLAGNVAPELAADAVSDPALSARPAAAGRAEAGRGRRRGVIVGATAGADRRQWRAHFPGLRAAAPARRGSRAAGGDDRGRQGVLCRDPPAGPGRVRHFWHRGGQCLHRRSRSGAGRRLEAQPKRYRLGKPRFARPGPADLCPDRHRAAQCLVELPGRACAARRRRGNPRPAAARGRGAWAGAATAGRTPGRRPSRASRLFQRPRLFRRRQADPAAAADRRVVARPAGECDRHLRRRRKPHHDDPFLPDQAGRGVLAGRRFGADGVRHTRRRSAPSWSIPTGRWSRCAAMAASR